MEQARKSRLTILFVIFGAIVLVHAVILSSIFPEQPHSGGDSPGQESSVTPDDAAAPPSTEPEPQAEKPGFWSRLFGGGGEPENQEEKTPPPAEVKLRYRQPSTNPAFGKPLDFSQARHGDLPSSLVPGSSGAVTGIVVDMNTRRVLWEKDSDKPVKLASMVKMMTMLLTFEELERNYSIDLSTPVRITQTARDVPRTGVLYLDPKETFPLSDLLKGTAIKSANDAATMIAEFIGGSVPAFVERMNQRAAELGLTATHFINPCGLTDPKRGDSVGSARDMVILGERLLEYPVLMEWLSTRAASIREGDKKTIFTNTNRLINPTRYPGVDGLKTGYFRAAGSCLTFSVLRNNRRIIGCVTGFKRSTDRDRFCRKLIDWAYTN